ncbi:MAG: LLM class flavin-dependent oxidoreductase [Deltaproteobacteria bacterium]|nr:LLM class flavin-dependent oxidoreductase [Deltaproteobacteria bacterium]
MKFGLFYQLPCGPSQNEVTRYHETIEQIAYADELGFDVAWLAELHFNRPFSIMPAPLLMATAIAQHTKRIRLGTGVTLLSLHHPLRAAEDAATVDILTNGRLEFGIGRGTIALHFQGFNVSRDESRERFEEALTIILNAWTQKSCQFSGKYFEIPETSVVPKPLQKPHPALRIAANSPETAVFAGTRGYPVLVAATIHPFPELPNHIAIYREAFNAAGHQHLQQDVAVAFKLFVTDSAEHARTAVEDSTMHYFQTVSHQAKLGQRDQSTSYAYLREVRQRFDTVQWDDIDRTMGIYGSPEACIRKITDAHRLCGMNQLISWFNPGGLVPHKQVLASMRRFAHEVMPAVQGL